MLSSRSSCRYIFTAVAIVLTLLLLGFHIRLSTPWTDGLIHGLPDFNSGSTTLPCRDLPGADETLVILKTGAGEIAEKLPIHLQTTFKCYPNTAIFSDYGEKFMDHTIVDVLEDVGPDFKAYHSDFDLYRKLQRAGHEALAPADLSGPSVLPVDSSGNPTVPGWKLDKYKFLPMMRNTLENYPEKKWYVFVEADTYIFWSSLLAYAAALDSDKPHYIGGQTWVGDVEFAHGGTGFLVSRRALEMVVAEYVKNKSEWEDFASGHWAGDCILGKAFKDAGVPLTGAWPIWQGDDVGNMNYDRVDDGERRQWCSPSVSYHHLRPAAIRDLWEFEQKWISNAGTTASDPFLRHRDVFAEYILPRTTALRFNWDNHSDKESPSPPSLSSSPDACSLLCEEDASCLQWAFSAEGRCLSTSKPNLGEPSNGTVSGWIPGRMRAFYDEGPDCGRVRWIT